MTSPEPALALVGPQVAFGLRTLLGESGVHSINAYDPLERLCGVGVLDLLLTGFYPAITWMPFVIAGMALGRLDLAAAAVQRRLAMLGPALIVLGYGMSWLALKIFGGAVPDRLPAKDAMPDMAAGSMPPPDKWTFQRGAARSLRPAHSPRPCEGPDQPAGSRDSAGRRGRFR